MPSGSICSAICLPWPNAVDHLPTLYVRFSTRSSTFCVPVALALLTSQFPAVANRVLPFPPIAPQRYLDAPAADSPSGRTRTPGEEPASERRDHGCGIRVKTVEESAGICGYDAHTCIKGRKRHLLVDTVGLPISLYVTPANVQDTRGARYLLAGLAPFMPRLKKFWADAAYRSQELAEWCKTEGGWDAGSGRTHTGYTWLQHSARA
jgi:hypothetical protein